MTINIKLPKIVAFIGRGVEGSKEREITHAELDNGKTIPASEITPRMWADAGMGLEGQHPKAH